MNKIIIQIAKKVLFVETRAKSRARKLEQRLEKLKEQKMESSLISVIVPVYNVENYLIRCLESIVNQTYQNIEILCVNDASTDKSLEILQTFAEQDDRFKVIDNQENEGAPLARKRALALAQGEFVLHVDSDDWLEETMLEDMLLLAQAESADIVYCDYFRNDDVVHTKKPAAEDKLERIQKWSFDFGNTLWNRLIKREVLEKVEFPAANMGDDVVINAQLYYYAAVISYCPKSLYHHAYLVNQGSISAANSQKNFKEMLENYQQVLEFCQEKFGDNPKINQLYQKKVAQIRERQRIVK
ncbi:glycosyltransferase family 2 protein [Lactococcus nasutitermitis]|uniref:Glycosyltransferase family 2 protein n=1 Tax=Lactococcus nasutitermitis TaxID=1652957 RepID=A0ABV9JCV8_9LACT|nr:glycosyltransferase family 2 protein [Lactococcus nasutitermitis]